ncbi:MAG TPA: hypothetical protein VLA04_03270 [Verrucomicrobiae bacterium]|nr:hypothetical protein [Verrucomicrobiae bacterium]
MKRLMFGELPFHINPARLTQFEVIAESDGIAVVTFYGDHGTIAEYAYTPKDPQRQVTSQEVTKLEKSILIALNDPTASEFTIHLPESEGTWGLH